MNPSFHDNRVTILQSQCPPKTWQWLRGKVGWKDSYQCPVIYLIEGSPTHFELIRRVEEEKAG